MSTHVLISLKRYMEKQIQSKTANKSDTLILNYTYTEILKNHCMLSCLKKYYF